MSKLDDVRALFIPGQRVCCVENTYHREMGRIGRVWEVEKVGKSVWSPTEDGGFRGTFPTRVSDVLHVDDFQATWRIGRGDHTVTYSRDNPEVYA